MQIGSFRLNQAIFRHFQFLLQKMALYPLVAKGKWHFLKSTLSFFASAPPPKIGNWDAYLGTGFTRLFLVQRRILYLKRRGKRVPAAKPKSHNYNLAVTPVVLKSRCTGYLACTTQVCCSGYPCL